MEATGRRAAEQLQRQGAKLAKELQTGVTPGLLHSVLRVGL